MYVCLSYTVIFLYTYIVPTSTSKMAPITTSTTIFQSPSFTSRTTTPATTGEISTRMIFTMSMPTSTTSLTTTTRSISTTTIIISLTTSKPPVKSTTSTTTMMISLTTSKPTVKSATYYMAVIPTVIPKMVPAMVPDVTVNDNINISENIVTLTLSWGEPFNNFDPIVNYTVSCSGDITCPPNFTTTDNTTRSYTITYLTTMTNYTFSVVATNSIGSGEAGVVMITTPPGKGASYSYLY